MDNIIEEKSFQFAIRIVKLSQYLRSSKQDFVLSKQVLRSGTSIGANVAEAKWSKMWQPITVCLAPSWIMEQNVQSTPKMTMETAPLICFTPMRPV